MIRELMDLGSAVKARAAEIVTSGTDIRPRLAGVVTQNAAMRRRSPLSLSLLGLLALCGFTAARDKSVEDYKREADRLAIAQLTTDMVQAFDKRDAAALAANWAEEGEFIRNDGEPVRGRSGIQKGYAEFFKTLKGKPRLEIRTEALRFPSADMAVTEATLRLADDQGEIVASGRQDTVLIREGGRWKAAIVREWDTGLDVSLTDLEWLIGTWQAIAKDREVTLAYEWDETKAFICGKFTVKEGTKVIETGTEVIGKDRGDGVIRSWVFQSDGGFGGGVWTRDGKKWKVDVHGVRADGRKLTATTIYVRVNPTTVTWQAVDQALDGVPVADTPPIRVTKQKPAD
jgi:uncharacterized protein (TIGR02246 family)